MFFVYIHILLETSREEIRCHCNKIFRRSRDLVRHQLRHHQSTTNEIPIIRDDEAREDVPSIADIISELAMPPPLSPIRDKDTRMSKIVQTVRVRAISKITRGQEAPLMRMARNKFNSIAEQFGQPVNSVSRPIPAQREQVSGHRNTKKAHIAKEDLTLLVNAYPNLSIDELMNNTISPLRLDPVDTAVVRCQLRHIKVQHCK